MGILDAPGAQRPRNGKRAVGQGELAVNVRDYGAVGDGRQVSDAAVTLPKTLTSATAAFTPADVGKTIIVHNAGAVGASLTTTIAAYTSATQVTLTDAATSAFSNLVAIVGTDDTAAFTSALAETGSLFLPEGYFITTAAITLAPGESLRGVGNNSAVCLPGVKVQTRCRIEGIRLVSNGAANSSAVSNVNTTAQTGVKILRSWFDSWTFAVNIDRTADNTQTSNWTIEDNTATLTASAFVYAVRLFDSKIAHNRSTSVNNNMQHVLITGGSRNKVTHNHFDYGRTGISFIFRRDLNGSLGPVFENVVTNNTLLNISEESVSFDTNASTGTTVAVVDRDTITAKANPSGTTYTVTLSNAGWSTAGSAWLNWWVGFTTGALKGQVAKITAQTNGTLTLALTAAQYAALTVGDQLNICMPFLRNVVANNTVDTGGRCISQAIYLYGLCYNCTVSGNTVLGSGANKGGITVQSMTDLAPPATHYTGTFGISPSEANTVTGNTVVNADLAVDLLIYGSTVYKASRNVVSGNTVVGGKVRYENQLDASGLGINTHDAGSTQVDNFGLLTIGQETMPRLAVQANAVSLTSTNMRLAYFTARKGESVANIRLVGNGAAAATPTLVRFGLYSVAADGSLSLLSGTTSDTTVFAAGGSQYTKALGSAVTLVAGQRYAVGVLVVSGATMPTLFGSPNVGGIGNESSLQAPTMCGVVNGQSDLPATVASGSVGSSAQMLYAVVTP